MFESSKYLYKQLYIMRSSILEKQGRTDIGLKLQCSVLLLPVLNTGVTFAIFKSSKSILLSKYNLNRYCKFTQSSLSNSLLH